MPTYACKTRNLQGEEVQKVLEAGSEAEVIHALSAEDLIPITIQVDEPQAALPSRRKAKKVKPRDLMRFSVQMGSALKAGVPIPAGLESISKQSNDEGFRGMIDEMIGDIQGGLPLSGAMRNQPRAFPPVYVGTVEAGEKSGSLDSMLDNLSEYLEAEMEMRSDIRTAVMYPAIVISTLVLAISVLIVFIVPRFAEFYSGFDTELPFATQVLIGGSEAVSTHGLWFLAGAVALVLGVRRLLRIQEVRRVRDRVVLKVPFVGRMLETAGTLRAVQMLGLFTQAGVPVVEGLRTIANATWNSKSREDLSTVAARIEAGGGLAEELEAQQCFPPAARQMLATGEATGSLERACSVICEQYKKELRYLTKNVATFIEPLLTLVLAGVVLFVALAAFLPMWDLVKVIGK